MKTLCFYLLTALCIPSLSFAQAEPSVTNVPTSIVLDANVEQTGLNPESLRIAIERELNVSVSFTATDAKAATLLVRVQGAEGKRRVTVSYRPDAREELTRTTDLPDDPERATDVIVWLAGNLTRNEAAELAAALEKAEPEQVDARPETGGISKEPEAPVLAAKPLVDKPKSQKDERAEPASDEPKFDRSGPFFDLSLFHPLTLFGGSERRVLNLELGLAYSNVGKIEGFALNPIVHRVHSLEGVQIGMVLTLAKNVQGVQLAAGASFARDVSGSQIASGASVARDVEGVQLGAGFSLARDVDGTQIAAGSVVARDVSGASIAGGVNVARSINGVQLGIINIAEEVSGAQVGVINVAKRVDGASVGAVSLVGNGRVQPVLWANSSMPANVAVKFIAGFMYTQIGLGYSPDSELFRSEMGVGGHLRVKNLFFEPALHFADTRDATNAEKDVRDDFIYRGAVGYDFEYVSVFGGAGLVHEVVSSEPLEAEFFAGIALF